VVRNVDGSAQRKNELKLGLELGTRLKTNGTPRSGVRMDVVRLAHFNVKLFQ
jgi:hypothetical protein